MENYLSQALAWLFDCLNVSLEHIIGEWEHIFLSLEHKPVNQNIYKVSLGTSKRFFDINRILSVPVEILNDPTD